MAKSKGNRIGLWIIIGLLFVGLIGFGSAGLNGGLRSIGSVGDKDLPVQSYANAITEQINALSAQFGVPITFAQAQQFGLPQGVLNQLVAERTIDNEAAQLGISAGDALVLEQILQASAFRGIDGEFDREAYNFSLNNRGQTEEAFETSLRENIARSLLQSAVIGGTPDATTYADAMIGFLGQRRSFTWATLDATALDTDIPAPTDSEVQAHYDANPDAYTAPEAREISYAWVTPDLLQDQIEIDEAMLQNLYQERINQFIIPERRLTERLILPSSDAAAAAIDDIAAGETDFETLVADRGLDLADVDMGDVSPGDLGAASDAVFAAIAGDVVGPFDTDLGPAIFRMNAVLSAQETTFEEARDDLEAELATASAGRLIRDMQDPINDLLAGGAALEDLADRTDLQLGTISWTAETTDGIAAYDAFRAAAAAAEQDAFPEMVELSDGGLFVLRLDGVTPPALRPFDEVRDQATQDRSAAATQEAVIVQTEQIISDLGTTNNFTQAGLEPNQEENLLRRDFIAGTPEGFMVLIFEMAEIGDITTMETDTGTVIIRLDSIDTVNLTDPAMEAERDSIAENVGNGIAQDIYGAYAVGVQLRTDIAIDDSAVAYINSNFR